jgi:AmiR/NasT family two-component response regulator
LLHLRTIQGEDRVSNSPQLAFRVLLAEDDIATALEFEDALKDAGYIVVGPALDHQDAADRISRQTFDAAVVDIGLALRAPEDVLRPLFESSTPIVFLTGYERPALPDWLPPVRICLKPCCPADLIEQLQEALPRTAVPSQG